MKRTVLIMSLLLVVISCDTVETKPEPFDISGVVTIFSSLPTSWVEHDCKESGGTVYYSRRHNRQRCKVSSTGKSREDCARWCTSLGTTDWYHNQYSNNSCTCYFG